MDERAVSILRGLANLPWIEVAFLIDAQGQVLVSVGSSAAFSHTGAFTTPQPVVEGEPETSLYMTGILPGIYLGVLFEADVSVEEVREEVARFESSLADAVRA